MEQKLNADVINITQINPELFLGPKNQQVKKRRPNNNFKIGKAHRLSATFQSHTIARSPKL